MGPASALPRGQLIAAGPIGLLCRQRLQALWPRPPL